jgi:hypothetical protein
MLFSDTLSAIIFALIVVIEKIPLNVPRFCFVSGPRLFNCIETPQEQLTPSVLDFRVIFFISPVPRDALYARRTTGRGSPVVLILRVRTRAKIFPFIV